MQSRLANKDVVSLRRRAAKGESDVSLAAAFGILRHSVVAIRTGVRWPNAGGPITRRREPPPSKGQRDRIRRALERGETQAQIAEREGCAISTVARVAHPVIGVRRIEALERELAALREEIAALVGVLSSVS